MEHEEAEMDEEDFRCWLIQRVRAIGSQRKAAEEWGIGKTFLCDVCRGRRRPGDKLLQVLGLKQVVTYAARYEETRG